MIVITDGIERNTFAYRFGMYVKLFIVMGVTWIIGIIMWLIHASNPLPMSIWNINYTIDILQGPVIFIIYVCKKKILRQLLKRFGWHHRDPFWNISASLARTSSTISSFTSSISFGSISMQQISPSHQQVNHHAESNK